MGSSRAQKWNLGVFLGVLWYPPIFLGGRGPPTEVWPTTGLKSVYDFPPLRRVILGLFWPETNVWTSVWAFRSYII